MKYNTKMGQAENATQDVKGKHAMKVQKMHDKDEEKNIKEELI